MISERRLAELRPFLLGMARRNEVRGEDAEDVVAITIGRLWAKRDSIEPDRLQAYATRVLINQIINDRRDAKRKPRVLFGDAPCEGDLGLPDELLLDDAPTALDLLMEDCDRRRANAVIATLPPCQAKVIALLADGQTYAEVASTLRLPHGTVKSRIYRAREFLMRHPGRMSKSEGPNITVTEFAPPTRPKEGKHYE